MRQPQGEAARPSQTATPRPFRPSNIRFQERRPRVIQDGNRQLSSSADRVLGDARSRPAQTARPIEIYTIQPPTPVSVRYYRRVRPTERRERVVYDDQRYSGRWL
ncbi:hypothetical protein NUU61_008854 [Penicillium alfredii]|uniref:Uncharacterized protein n=1 Tax=Penicillium alfredii TaxID=1506179 RepID=A0A9W9EM66_9EURO|nr:uncharacterized protein NUU61_008854 [Penicillium alfredii]KAJ5084275.1 hypothetical protein NUU61_008854 [Penicillium alfredii]